MSVKLEQTGARLDKSIAIKQEDSISFLISVVLTKYDFIMKTSLSLIKLIICTTVVCNDIILLRICP